MEGSAYESTFLGSVSCAEAEAAPQADYTLI